MLFTDPTRPLREQLGDAHRAAIAGLDAFVAIASVASGERLARWESFAENLLATMDAEERELLPDFLEAHERDARAIVREHHDLRLRVRAVRSLLAAGSDVHLLLPAELDALAASLRAHTAHEERLLYAWADGHDVKPR